MINDIMDDKTAAATQRWQRLMIQAAAATPNRKLSKSAKFPRIVES